MSTVAVEAPRRHRARHAASIILLVLVSILTPFVVTAGWAVSTITNTDRFVSTMSALGTNPTVTNYAAAQGAATLVDDLHVQARIAQRLPPAAAPLAPLLTNELRTQLASVFAKVLASPQFQSVWTAKIRLLHGAFVTAMTSNGTKVSQASQLALDVTPQILKAIDTLDAKGITLLDPARQYLTGDKHVLVQLADAKGFHQVQLYFHLATTLRWVLWAVTLVLAVFAILLDPRRRRSGFWLGIGVASSCVVMLTLLAVGKQYAVSHSSTPADVTNVVFSTLTSWLRWELRVLVIIGLLAAIVLWGTGSSGTARSIRGAFAKGGGATGKAVEGVVGDRWLATYATVLAWLGVVVGGIVLGVWVDSLLWAAVTILLVAAWFASMVSLRRRAGAASPVDAG